MPIPSVFALTTSEWQFGTLMEDGCLSSNPDFPISFHGRRAIEPDGNSRFVWELPVSPFDTQCGYLDRDGDGLLDWAETELAWVFRPYVVMDHSEEWAGNASM
ncbi:hypothetical protein KKD52_01765, partial [Myxococcota bacterium]|nr:hypothetical protein [Myxococcota bacterium]MBU1509060.1 hypothetical protein [Myxococcota bacterium]